MPDGVPDGFRFGHTEGAVHAVTRSVHFSYIVDDIKMNIKRKLQALSKGKEVCFHLCCHLAV